MKRAKPFLGRTATGTQGKARTRLPKGLIAGGLVLLSAVPVLAASFGELDAWCASPELGGRPRLCPGYLETLIQGLASTDPSLKDGIRACVPEVEDRAEVVRLLRAYARDNPSLRDRRAWSRGQGSLPVPLTACRRRHPARPAFG